MSSLSTKVKLYLEANGKSYDSERLVNFNLQDDGSGAYIRDWNVDGITKPTDNELNALESQADEEETLNEILSNRQAEYPSVQELVVALYDTDDKSAIEAKRAAVKKKYPKP